MLKLYQNKEWLYKKYWIEKLPTCQIGELCGVCRETIRRWLKRFDIPFHLRGRSDIKTDKLVEIFKRGKTVGEISKIYNVSRSCVQRRFKKRSVSITKLCKYCGKEFQTSNNSKIYCGIKCAGRASRDIWIKNHPLENKLLGLKTRIKFRKKLVEKLGGKCGKCGETDWRVLQINHINGNGRKERARIGKKIYTNILKGKDIDKYNLLCANCNILYEYEKGKRKDERWIEKNISKSIGG